MQLIATTSFGLEAIVARELKSLGYEDQTIADGRITFQGDMQAICRTNLWLRSADRIFLKVGSFTATDFGQLFDQTKAIKWSDILPQNAIFPVRGRSVRSQLHSVPDAQSIIKKAIVEQMKEAYHVDWFDEEGASYAVEFSILKDEVTLAIDTSGKGLNKRGYRTLNSEAPLKETLAAALIQLSYWNRERPFVDPFCGSGTIPIEAALIARNIAPGIHRTFAADHWKMIDATEWDNAREEAKDLQKEKPDYQLIGTDIDRSVIKTARYHAQQAGVFDDIYFEQKPIEEFSNKRKYGCIICNPPYGERSGTDEQAKEIYRMMGEKFNPLETWSKYILTSHDAFEKQMKKKADRRRKLYNGNLACTYFQYQGPPPPRKRVDAT